MPNETINQSIKMGIQEVIIRVAIINDAEIYVERSLGLREKTIRLVSNLKGKGNVAPYTLTRLICVI